MHINKKKVLGLFTLMSVVFVSMGRTLDIPLSGGTESGGGMKLGYVDMDRIFQVFPQTQSAKDDYAKQLKKKRDQLAAKEAELKDVEGKISVLESTMKGSSPAPDAANPATDSAADNASQSLLAMRKDLEDKKTEMDELRKQAKSDLAAFERQQSQLILGKIYEALRDVALEEQVAVVVDKNSILYGDASIDLTDKLQQRVRGY